VHMQTLSLLQAYSWPGNVRQLENAVFRAVVLSESNELLPSDFPQVLGHVSPIDAAISATNHVETRGAFVETHDVSNGGWANVPGDALSAFAAGSLKQLDQDGNVRQMIDMEEEIIRFAISHYNGQMSEVARRLGIGRSTLYRKLKDFGIDPDEGMKLDESAA
jgi:DNA-binding NtrC family response regulator